jgi:prepilin signal peptidase PulO-like enzyme (type II secretory pathway)
MNELSPVVAVLVVSILGLCFGSFINALVWRLHEKRNFVNERSECTHCHHVLAWYDLIPVISWLTLMGKCRYCKKPIAAQYPLVELLTAILFVGSYYLWPYGWAAAGTALFVLWLIMVIVLVALAVYDLRWMLLPDKLTFPLVGMSVVAGLVLSMGVEHQTVFQALTFLATGVASLAGVYYVLYMISKGAWVGFGDIKLTLAMGLAGGWKVGLITLMLANVIGLLVVLPGLLSGKLTRTSRVPFGPFLIAGFIIAYLGVQPITNWYVSLLF